MYLILNLSIYSDYGNVPVKWNYKSRQLNNFEHGGYENENNNFRSFKEREGQDP